MLLLVPENIELSATVLNYLTISYPDMALVELSPASSKTRASPDNNRPVKAERIIVIVSHLITRQVVWVLSCAVIPFSSPHPLHEVKVFGNAIMNLACVRNSNIAGSHLLNNVL